MKNLIFIGGIHGVGKGTFCDKISSQTNSIHLSSSELIKWTDISSIQNKKVFDINKTQDRLLIGLDRATKTNKKYILDGHFCLLNKQSLPTDVPFETFQKINPKSLIIITEKVNVIYERLNKRDNLSYSLKFLEEFQKKEIARAKEISEKLKIKLFIYKNNFNDALIFINNTL